MQPKLDEPGSLVPEWARRFKGKIVVFNPRPNESVRSGHLYVGECTHVTPKGPDNGLPDAELRVEGQTGRSKFIRVVANSAEPFDSWSHAAEYIRPIDPENPILGALLHPEPLTQNLEFEFKPTRTEWDDEADRR